MTKNKKTSVTFVLDKEEYIEIGKLAKQQQCSTAAILRQAISLYLTNREEISRIRKRHEKA